jgi:hypothetical protein
MATYYPPESGNENVGDNGIEFYTADFKKPNETIDLKNFVLQETSKLTGDIAVADAKADTAINATAGLTNNYVVIANGATATGNAIAIGSSAEAGSAFGGDGAIAIGSGSLSRGEKSIAIGKNCDVGSNTNSIGIGADITIDENDRIKIGTSSHRTNIDGILDIGNAIDSESNPSRNDGSIIIKRDDYSTPFLGALDKKGHLVLINQNSASGANGAVGTQITFGQSWSASDPTFTIATGAIAGIKTTNDGGFGGGLAFYTHPAANSSMVERMRITDTGYFGIGTTTPLVPLHITSRNNYSLTSTGKYFLYNSSSFSSAIAGQNIGFTSIVALGNIGSGGSIFAYSDRRIKKDIVEINDDTALQQIRSLKPCTYKYIDTILKGGEEVIGFIAQEVKESIPTAVKIETGDIPNVMLMGSCSGDIITIPDFDTSTLELDASGNIFPKLKLIIDDEDKELFVNIQEVVSATELRVELIGEDNTELPSDLFIYGQEVDNKHLLIKERLFSVGISALQEVDRQQQADKERIEILETQLASVLARLDALETA